jgi:hypothetical protein
MEYFRLFPHGYSAFVLFKNSEPGYLINMKLSLNQDGKPP